MSESGVGDRVDGVVVSEFMKRLRSMDRDLDDGQRIDLLRGFEQLKSACAAAQAKLTADLDRSRRAERAATGVAVQQCGRGIAAEVALARQVSPHQGGRHLGFARAVVYEMPHTLGLLEQGLLSEWRATLLVRETACLTREDRTAVDAELCADPTVLAGLGDRGLAAKARKHAAARDVEALVRRARKAVADRRVSTRPAPETMAYLSALLPVAQAVAVQARLYRDAGTIVAAGDPAGRSRAQIMADLLVARVSGTDPLTGPPITVNLVLSDNTLLAGGTDPAFVPGYGPIPADIAGDWVRHRLDPHATESTQSVLALRRLYAHPGTGALTATESSARCFPTGLARFLDLRDQVCRSPYCDAPIRHHDHIRDHHRGGATTAGNGAGLCQACNHAKQGTGWHTTPEPDHPGRLHSYLITTPTGHTHHCTAPPLPQPLRIEIYRTIEDQLIEVLTAA